MPNVPTDRANSGEMQRKLKNKSLTQRISYNLPQRAGGVKKKMRHRAEEYSGQVSHKLWGLAALVTSVIAIPVSTAFIATHRIKEAEDSSFRKCQRKRERISNGIFQVFFFFYAASLGRSCCRPGDKELSLYKLQSPRGHKNQKEEKLQIDSVVP